MQALKLIAPGHVIFAEDTPSRALVDQEIRVRVASTSICGSDLKNIANPVQTPQTPGHEFSGTVIEVNPGSDHAIKLGQRITAFPMISCMHCAACRSGHRRDCENKLSLGFNLPGSFAEEVIFDGRFAVPLHDAITFEQGALVEHMACGYRLAREVEQAHPGREARIVIVGDGPVALADLQALRQLGYDDVTLVGKHATRMEMAKRLGANVRDRNDAAPFQGIDICIMAAPASSTLLGIVPFMVPHSVLYPQTRFEESIVTMAERNGIRMGRAFAYHMQDFDAVMDLMATGEFVTEPLVTVRIDLKEAVQTLTALLSDKAGHIKALIKVA